MSPPRTVVSLEPLGAEAVMKLAEAPTNIPGLGDNMVVDLSAPVGPGVLARGAELHRRLCAHPPIRDGLGAMSATPLGAGAAPLYFRVVAAAADALPWEELYADDHGFLALDPRWPVARIARRARPVVERVFAGELTLVAVLSAAGRSGLAQARALLEAVSSQDGRAVGARLVVISAEDAVLKAVAAAALPYAQSQPMANDAAGLARQIAAANPDVLHLLAHGGQVMPGVSTLVFADAADLLSEAPAGSVSLQLANIIQGLLGADPWLVVLAACESAAATDTAGMVTGGALAHEIALGGVPAVLGMRRLVDVTAADRCVQALYPAVLADVRAAAEATDHDGEIIDWAGALTGARAALAGADPAQLDGWADPVLYVGCEEFRVRAARLPGDALSYADLLGERDALQRYLSSVDGIDPTVAAKVRRRVADLDAELARVLAAAPLAAAP
ncbi:CHAT domain-containing protein [Pilimelia columellifera]|uniref:CHAT domain-containing protein n=1 Tax=Pilimelia columellifera subsp. columellifera TaxID=706583 RepID=A0ABP6AI34_9ACTN